ncbi:CLUMA_CG002237, isoform A [Clunio marinus]|uniref:CLUMA_CG002237, isoform A n=1 Tax=Clunio marinus TaxID=568069 RepID=A0A1J1HK76_9DIPT|nr:CLUMA_CG002237, isoform A [Clunio marinus]
MLIQLCRKVLTDQVNNVRALRTIHTTVVNKTFWEKEKKSGYAQKYPLTSKKMILDGLKEFKSELNLWKEEMKEKFESDPILVFRPGEIDVIWKFSEEQDLDKWVVTSDKDHNQGLSVASFERSPAGFGLFSGNLSSELPIDGRIKKAGYCNIKSMRQRKSFKRETSFDWSTYNTLVMRVRGDGRPYLINLSCEAYHDMTWNDIYHYILYTRGGPHWQVTKIPFSKFFYASKGRVQDKQVAFPVDRVTSVGFSVSGRAGYDGNFSLEVDYIGLEFDPHETEDFAYETYKVDKYIVQT